MQCFDDALAYLKFLENDADYAIIPFQMAAEALGVSRGATAYRVRSGSLKAVQIGSARYIFAASLSNLVSQRRAEVETVKSFLVDIASCGAATTYAPVMGKVDRVTTVPNDRAEIGKILCKISEESFEEHGFLLSALVMKGKLGRPSDAFFNLAERLDPRYRRAASNDAYIKKQLKRIHKHYVTA